MLNYGFFDYKYNIPDFGSDLFSVAHIVYIVLATVCVIALGVLLRNARRERVELFLKIFSFVLLFFEITKITWESYYDITTGRGLNVEGLLPLYTCSLFIYTVFLSAWGGGKVKEYSLKFVATISMLSGFIGVIYCNGLNFYPFFTFGAFYSLFFHTSMFATGFILLATGYVRLSWRDIYRGWIPMVAMSIVAVPVNYALKVDYMQIYEGSGVPLMSKLAPALAEIGLRPLFTYIMLASYMLLSTVVVAIAKLVEHIAAKNKKTA